MSTTTTRYEFPLPDPGEGLTEAEIVEWHVADGDTVDEDDVLCEIETDKAVTEVPSPCHGTVDELVADVGETVQVGEAIVVFETEDLPAGEGVERADEDETGTKADEPSETTETSETPEEGETDEVIEAIQETTKTTTEGTNAEETEVAEGGAELAQRTGEERVFAAPSTRRYAREQDVNLASVSGSGPNSRVLREDINTHLENQREREMDESVATADSTLRHPTVAIEPTSIDEDEACSERRALSGLRARIAENMVESKTVIPHVTSGFEADATELVALKQRLNEKHDVHITYTPLLVKAVVPALKAFPMVNASVDDETDEIVVKHYYNIGVATHTDDGLLVPVVKETDTKSVVGVAAELGEHIKEARNRTIDITDLSGGTFTVTNVGSHGGHGTSGTPIINHPEAAIMGIGGIENKPVAVNENDVEVRKRIGLTLSFDHRIIDGMTANQFMEHVIQGIEDPDLLFSRL